MPEPPSLLPVDPASEEARWQRRVRKQEFLGYYNRELQYLKDLGADFGETHKVVASRLRLQPNQGDDPHVERLIESFAFLAARIHTRLDDEFPEIAGALLEELYPNFTRPVPSSCIVEFRIDPETGKQTSERRIPRLTPLHSRHDGNFACKFRTCYDTELWPLSVESASWQGAGTLPAGIVKRQTAAALDLRIVCPPGVTFQSLELKRLRFFIDADPDVAYPLYELLTARCHSVVLRNADSGKIQDARCIELKGSPLSPVGFAAEESLCWDGRGRRGFAGYDLVEDYFSLPEKFLFLDLSSLEKAAEIGCTQKLSIVFLISPYDRTDWRSVLEQRISARTFRLNCTPAVNLFEANSKQIPVREQRYELPVECDSSAEIYSIESVHGNFSGSTEKVPFARYIECDREVQQQRPAGYWTAARRPSRTRYAATELFISLLGVGDAAPPPDSITARLTCTNGERPSALRVDHPDGDFTLNRYPEVTKVACVRSPSRGASPAADRTSLWRLLSQLSLNHLSLLDGNKAALQCLLRIHNLAGGESGEENIGGIAGIGSEPHFTRVTTEHGTAFIRGKRIHLTLDEARFVGRGAFLFAAVLDRFFGLYTSLNSFAQLSVRSLQRGERPIFLFPPRAGLKAVL